MYSQSPIKTKYRLGNSEEKLLKIMLCLGARSGSGYPMLWELKGERVKFSFPGCCPALLGRHPTYLSADFYFTGILLSFFFFSPIISELAERNSTKVGHCSEVTAI